MLLFTHWPSFFVLLFLTSAFFFIFVVSVIHFFFCLSFPLYIDKKQRSTVLEPLVDVAAFFFPLFFFFFFGVRTQLFFFVRWTRSPLALVTPALRSALSRYATMVYTLDAFNRVDKWLHTKLVANRRINVLPYWRLSSCLFLFSSLSILFSTAIVFYEFFFCLFVLCMSWALLILIHCVHWAIFVFGVFLLASSFFFLIARRRIYCFSSLLFCLLFRLRK